MAIDVSGIGDPQVANRAFVALAVEAGIEAVILSLVPLAMNKRDLLIALKEALGGGANPPNAPLANALNIQTLDAILEYCIQRTGFQLVNADQLPALLDQDGPASVTAARDGGTPTQVNVTFNEPSSGFEYELYVGEQMRRHGNTAGVSGWVNEAIPQVALGACIIRVLYVRTADGALTRFGPLVHITS